MNRRIAVRTAASVALIVLSTSSAATDCERRNDEARDDDSRSSSQVVVRADDDVCWKVTVDDRTHRGCGDAKFYGHRRSDRHARVERVDGDKDIEVTLVVNGETVDRERVRDDDHGVYVDDHRSTKSKKKSSDDA